MLFHRHGIAHRLALSAGTLALVLGASLVGGCNKPNSMLRQEGIRALDERKDVDTAEKKFEQAVQQDDTDWKSMYYLGRIRTMQGRGLDAQVLLERALIIRDSHEETPDILDALAESIYKQRHDASLAAMLKKAADDYGTVRDYNRQGKYLGLIGDIDGAKLAYRKAMKFAAPNDPSPYLALSELLESQGDNEGAIQNLKYAYYILPESPRLEARFRKFGIVPGPTVAVKPPVD